MLKQKRLLTLFSDAVKAGGGVHTSRELAFMMGEPMSPVFTKFLSDCVRKGLIRRVAKGMFRATTPQAIADLKACNRNIPMVEN